MRTNDSQRFEAIQADARKRQELCKTAANMRETVQVHPRRPPAPIQRSKSTKSLAATSPPHGSAKQLTNPEPSAVEPRLTRTYGSLRVNGKRPFASYYYTSSFPSLYSMFSDRGMAYNGSSNVRPSTMANGVIRSDNAQQALPNPEHENTNQTRFPWRQLTNSEAHDTKSKKSNDTTDDVPTSIDHAEKSNDQLSPTKSWTKANGAAVSSSVQAAASKATDSPLSNNDVNNPKHDVRPPPGGQRTRSKSWASRPNDATATSTGKVRHHSSNSYTTTSTYAPFKNPAPMPIWSPNERIFTLRTQQNERKSVWVESKAPELANSKSRSYSEFNRTNSNYKAAFANSYSAHLAPDAAARGRARRKLLKTAHGVRFSSPARHKDHPRDNTKNSPVQTASDEEKNVENSPEISEDPKALTRTDSVTRPSVRHAERYYRITNPGLQHRMEAKRELTNRLTNTNHATPHRRLADNTIDAALIYKEHFRPAAKKNFLTPEQLVIRDSVEKVQRWIRTLPRHFDTIHHVLPPVRQDY